MSLASFHVNKMALGVINLKTGCCTKTWLSVALSTLVSALLSSSFLRTNLTFLLRSLLFRSWGNQLRKMSTWTEASGAMGSVEDAASKAEIQSSLKFRSGFLLPDLLYRMWAFNKETTDFINFLEKKKTSKKGHFRLNGRNEPINKSTTGGVACEASVSVLFRSKGHAKNGASKREGGGEERKETLADKPRDFENHPQHLSCPVSYTHLTLPTKLEV